MKKQINDILFDLERNQIDIGMAACKLYDLLEPEKMENNKLAEYFINHLKEKNNEKEVIVKRLFVEKNISIEDAILLMNNNEIFVNVQALDISSGAKVAGGSIFTSDNELLSKMKR